MRIEYVVKVRRRRDRFSAFFTPSEYVPRSSTTNIGTNRDRTLVFEREYDTVLMEILTHSVRHPRGTKSVYK